MIIKIKIKRLSDFYINIVANYSLYNITYARNELFIISVNKINAIREIIEA